MKVAVPFYPRSTRSEYATGLAIARRAGVGNSYAWNREKAEDLRARAKAMCRLDRALALGAARGFRESIDKALHQLIDVRRSGYDPDRMVEWLVQNEDRVIANVASLHPELADAVLSRMETIRDTLTRCYPDLKRQTEHS